MRRLILGLCLLACSIFASDADRVLIVRNSNSPVSKAVAADYAEHRGVSNVVEISCQDSALKTENETIEFKNYQEQIETPLRGYLAAHPTIDFIVLTKGVPIRIKGAPFGPEGGAYALDSYVAALDYDKSPNAFTVDLKWGKDWRGRAWANRFWNSSEPFSHAKFGGYLVTRLDGYTEADASLAHSVPEMIAPVYGTKTPEIPRMKPFILALSISALATFAAPAAEDPAEILLWPNGAPGSEGKTDPETVKTSGGGERQVSTVHKPSITPFLPAKDKANGCAVLVIPGGGHTVLCVDHEGTFVAQFLVDHGIAAFVLKHRLAREKGSTYTIEGHAVPDAQRAMRLIRSRAAEWNIDPNRLGAIGFSAGGELVNAASLLPGEGKTDAADPIDKLNSRPSFQGLIYPGLSINIKPEKDSPPAFLACSINDRQDIAEGLAEAYLRFKRAGASAELHIYATGNHGFGYRPTSKGAVAGWADRFVEWLASKNFLTAAKK